MIVYYPKLNRAMIYCFLIIMSHITVMNATSVKTIDTQITSQSANEYQEEDQVERISTVTTYSFIQKKYTEHDFDQWQQNYIKFRAFEAYQQLIKEKLISPKGVVLGDSVQCFNQIFRKHERIKLVDSINFYKQTTNTKHIFEMLKQENIINQDGVLLEKMDSSRQASFFLIEMNERSQIIPETVSKINQLNLNIQHSDQMKDQLIKMIMLGHIVQLKEYSSIINADYNFLESLAFALVDILIFLPMRISVDHYMDYFYRDLHSFSLAESYFPDLITSQRYPQYVEYSHSIHYPDTVAYRSYKATSLNLFYKSGVTYLNHDIKLNFKGKNNGQTSSYLIVGNTIQGFKDSDNHIYTITPYLGSMQRYKRIKLESQIGFSYYNGLQLNQLGMYLAGNVNLYIFKPFSLYLEGSMKVGEDWRYQSFRYGLNYQYKNIEYQLGFHKLSGGETKLLSGIEGGIKVLF